MTIRSTIHPLLALAFGLAAAAPAAAADGVIEISQARAMAGGVTVGDSAGFPVTISQSGSYRLTGSLDVTLQPSPATVTAIEITASFVTLDLNGFSLIGPTVCSGTPVTSCSPAGSGSGISSHTANFVRIHNGSIRGFGSWGIHAGNATVVGVQASNNGMRGIWLEFGGLVRSCAAFRNGIDGITGGGVVAQDSRAWENGIDGFNLYPGNVTNCEAVDNHGVGIRVGAGLVVDSVARDNDGCAIAAIDGAYGRNVVFGTATLCGGEELGQNLCNGTATCP